MQFRSIPAVTDGLKAGGRRVLWTARDGKKYKSASLAGATMPIHPHASPEGAIDTLAAPYGNNIPLFKGDGAFGTLLNPTAYGASRYTSVTVSKFAQDVMFRDIEIIPMTENYDGTLEEPVHFLPLVPVVLINPAEGIAIGFATNILPRSLDDIILAQLAHLKKSKSISPLTPKFIPLDNQSHMQQEAGRGIAYYFKGEVEHINATTVRITKIPYGLDHQKVTNTLEALCEQGTVTNFEDLSRDVVDIVVQFKRGVLRDMSPDEVVSTLGLVVRHIENLNVLDFSGKSIWNTDPVALIRKFTDWRLEWYVSRYERLKSLLEHDIQRYYDIRIAITNNVGAAARKTVSRAELKILLDALGIVNLDYIADLPIYRFTEDEKKKNEQRIAEAEIQLQKYKDLLNDESLRRKVYIKELEEVLAKYSKGDYEE
jgi:DNA gyrase/topoisomerase IV subunit A